MLSLVIDEGNSLVKLSIMSGLDNIDRSCIVKTLDVETLEQFIANDDILEAIYSSVRCKNSAVLDYLHSINCRVVELQLDMQLPIKIDYDTVNTLGVDRIAAAIGAIEVAKGGDILIIDLGSAITFDFVDNSGVFRGGNIAPGASLRYKALSDYTQNLPYCSLPESNTELCSKSTKSAVANGVAQGIVCEIEGYIGRYRAIYPEIKIFFTGGDAIYFASKIKNTIFADYDLVKKGLYKVLRYSNDKI